MSQFARPTHQNGFTLIEMLVVLVVIGIIVSTAVLSIRSGDISVEMEVEMRRIQTLINLAREEAILQGQELALRIEPDNYGFEVFQDNNWQPIAQDKLLRTRQLKFGMALALVVDDAELALIKPDQEDRDPQQPARIYILSSGEMSPFELILRSPDESVQLRIRAEEDGKLQLLLPQDLS